MAPPKVAKNRVRLTITMDYEHYLKLVDEADAEMVTISRVLRRIFCERYGPGTPAPRRIKSIPLEDKEGPKIDHTFEPIDMEDSPRAKGPFSKEELDAINSLPVDGDEAWPEEEEWNGNEKGGEANDDSEDD